MTAPDHSVPDGAYTITSLPDLQALDEAKVRQRLNQPATNALEQIKASLATNLLGGIADALRGIFTPGGPFVDLAAAAKDGQEDLRDRLDLLSPLLDYGSFFAPLINDTHSRYGPDFMAFTEQLAAAQNVELVALDTGREVVMLQDKGIWDIRGHVVVDWYGGTNPDVWVDVCVYKPDKTLFSSERSMERTNNITTFNFASSVTIPEPGYFVLVNIARMHKGRGVFGGPKYTRLTVQHISRETQGGANGSEQSSPDPSQTGPN